MDTKRLSALCRVTRRIGLSTLEQFVLAGAGDSVSTADRLHNDGSATWHPHFVEAAIAHLAEKLQCPDWALRQFLHGKQNAHSTALNHLLLSKGFPPHGRQQSSVDCEISKFYGRRVITVSDLPFRLTPGTVTRKYLEGHPSIVQSRYLLRQFIPALVNAAKRHRVNFLECGQWLPEAQHDFLFPTSSMAAAMSVLTEEDRDDFLEDLKGAIHLAAAANLSVRIGLFEDYNLAPPQSALKSSCVSFTLISEACAIATHRMNLSQTIVTCATLPGSQHVAGMSGLLESFGSLVQYDWNDPIATLEAISNLAR